MSATVLYMSMSFDGFITGPNEGPDNPLGDGGHRLHEWFLRAGEDDFQAAFARLRGANRQVYEELMSTGAVVAGCQTFEPAGGWGGENHVGVPTYILSRNPAPAWAAEWPAVHYVRDLDAAVRDAKRAAGDKNVLVHGANSRSARSPQGSSTSSRSMSSRCSSAKDAVISASAVTSRSNWSAPGFSRGKLVSPTCTTASTLKDVGNVAERFRAGDAIITQGDAGDKLS